MTTERKAVCEGCGHTVQLEGLRHRINSPCPKCGGKFKNDDPPARNEPKEN